MGRFVTNHGTFSSNYFFSELDSLLCFPLRSYVENIGYGKWQKIGVIISFAIKK